MNQSYLKSPKQGVKGVQVRNALERKFPDVWFSVQKKRISGKGVVMKVAWVDESISDDDIQEFYRLGLLMFFSAKEFA